MSYNEYTDECSDDYATAESVGSVADTLLSAANEAIAALGAEYESLKDTLSYKTSALGSAHAELIALHRRLRQYRTGSHNPRNIYRSGADRDTDEHIGVMFTPEVARLVVWALNTHVTPNASRVDEANAR